MRTHTHTHIPRETLVGGERCRGQKAVIESCADGVLKLTTVSPTEGPATDVCNIQFIHFIEVENIQYTLKYI